jgi:uncharacterized protein
MEDPRPQLQNALKEAIKSKDTRRRDTIRMAQNAIRQVEIDTRQELSAPEVVDILQKEVKKRRESLEEYERAGRNDLAEQEGFEVAVLEEFLPRQLSEQQLIAIVREVIAETGASSPRDMGKVMGPVMQRVRGLADGKIVNQVVRDLLNA